VLGDTLSMESNMKVQKSREKHFQATSPSGIVAETRCDAECLDTQVRGREEE